MRITATQAIESKEHLEKAISAYSIALNEILNGKTSPVFEKGIHKFFIVGENRANGGIVVYTFMPENSKPSSQVFYWEEWAEGNLKHAAAIQTLDSIDLRELIFKAQEWVMKSH